MNEKLKPCPFCGGEAVLLGDKEKHDNYRVACCNCGTRTVEEHISTIAISTWNRRANTMNELKPCPFCNGEAHTQYTRSNGRWYVVCGNCHASTTDYLDSDDAIKAWNERTMPLTMPPHVISEIEKAAKAIHDCVEVCDMCVAYGKCGLIDIDHEAYQCRNAIAITLARAAGWNV